MHRVRGVTVGEYYLGGSIEPPEPPLATGLCRHLSVPTTLQCQDDTNGVLMEYLLCCLSTLISGVKARSAFGTPWWLQQHCDTHTWGVTLTCLVSRHVAPVLILAPTRGSLPILMSMVPYVTYTYVNIMQ